MSVSDYLIAGAGVIGVTLARELKKRAPEAKITILEKEPAPGLHASGRNSGVLHSGIYYPPDTLKARVCAKGGAMMAAFAQEHGVPLKKAGKVIIATREEDLPTLDRLMENAVNGGIRAVKMDAEQIRRIEPYCDPHKAGIYLPDVHVIDPKKAMRALAEEAVAAGVEIRFGERVAGFGNNEALTANGRYPYGKFVNCAGAYADVIANLCGAAKNYRLIPFKGIYYKLREDRRSLSQGLIYPAPDLNFPFLGVHFTTGTNGEVYAGPTAIPALGRENYAALSGVSIKEAAQISVRLAGMYIAGGQGFRRLVQREAGRYLKPKFLEAAKVLVPSLTSEDLVACDKTGIRPQLVDTAANRLVMDFMAEKAGRSYHVLNAISPAFTGSLAFAELLASAVMQDDGTGAGPLVI